MKRKKLLIFGHYGVPNWGDEAILHGILRAIDTDYWQITVVSPFSEFISQNYSVACVPPPPAGIRSWIRLIFARQSSFRAALQSADLVLFGGGGLFQESPPQALKIWNMYLQKCIQYKKRILVVANSLGPFLSQKSFTRTARLFANISFFSLRDTHSVNILRQMNIAEEKFLLASDAAFFLPQRRRDKKRKKGVIIALRNGDLSKSEIQEIQRFCVVLQKKKIPVQFLSMQSNQSADQEIGRRLGIPLCFPLNFAEVREQITSANFVLANRLHAGILAMLSATPLMMISSRPKITNFFTSAGLSEVLISSISQKKLWQKYTQINKQYEQLQKDIRLAVKQEKQKAKHIFPDFL